MVNAWKKLSESDILSALSVFKKNYVRVPVQQQKKRRAAKEEEQFLNSDDQFAFIAGYTENGCPYGTTWDEVLEDAHREGVSEPDIEGSKTLYHSFHGWAPDIRKWPKSWMGVKEDLEYGKELLPYFEEFLQELYNGGLSRKTFAQYRDNLWLLGGSIITKVSIYEEYHTEVLDKLLDSVACDGILPDHYDQMSDADLRSFSRMCRKFEKFLHQHYGSLF